MRAHHGLVAAATSAVILFALAGCVPDPGADLIESPNPSHTPFVPSAVPTADPTASAVPITGVPLTLGCADLVTLAQMYDFDQNVGPIDEYTPAPGSYGAQAEDLQGLACGWVHQTNGSSIDIAVADVPEPGLSALKTQLGALGDPAPAFPGEGYFRVENGTGVAVAFVGEYWITVSSRLFFEAGDVAQLLATIDGNLG